MAKAGKAGSSGRAGLIGDKSAENGKVIIYTPDMIRAMNAELARKDSKNNPSE